MIITGWTELELTEHLWKFFWKLKELPNYTELEDVLSNVWYDACIEEEDAKEGWDWSGPISLTVFLMICKFYKIYVINKEE